MVMFPPPPNPGPSEAEVAALAAKMQFFAEVAGPFSSWRRIALDGAPTDSLIRSLNNTVIDRHGLANQLRLDPDAPRELPTINADRTPVELALDIYARHYGLGERGDELFNTGGARLVQEAVNHIFGEEFWHVIEQSVVNWERVDAQLEGSVTLRTLLTNIYTAFDPEGSSRLVDDAIPEIGSHLDRTEIARRLARPFRVVLDAETASARPTEGNARGRAEYEDRVRRAFDPGQRNYHRRRPEEREPSTGRRLDRELDGAAAARAQAQEALRAQQDALTEEEATIAAPFQERIDGEQAVRMQRVTTALSQALTDLTSYQNLVRDELVDLGALGEEERTFTEAERRAHPYYHDVLGLGEEQLTERATVLGRKIGATQTRLTAAITAARQRAAEQWLAQQGEILSTTQVVPVEHERHRGRDALAAAALVAVAAAGTGTAIALSRGTTPGRAQAGPGTSQSARPGPQTGPTQGRVPPTALEIYLGAEGPNLADELLAENRTVVKKFGAAKITLADANELVTLLSTDPIAGEDRAYQMLNAQDNITPVTVRFLTAMSARAEQANLRSAGFDFSYPQPIPNQPTRAEQHEGGVRLSRGDWALSLSPNDPLARQIRATVQRDEADGYNGKANLGTAAHADSILMDLAADATASQVLASSGGLSAG